MKRKATAAGQANGAPKKIKQQEQVSLSSDDEENGVDHTVMDDYQDDDGEEDDDEYGSEEEEDQGSKHDDTFTALLEPQNASSQPSQPDRHKHVKLQDLLHLKSLFSLQSESLLDQVTPKTPAVVKETLRHIKQQLDKSTSTGDLSHAQALDYLHAKHVLWPWQLHDSDTASDKEVMYSFRYDKPTRIDVMGSWLLGGEGKGAVVKRKHGKWNVDLAVQMPSSLFQQKDHLNHRYFHKRAFYLAVVAVFLSNLPHVEPSFSFFQSDPRRPMLHLALQHNSKAQHVVVNIHLTVADDVFKLDRLSPGRNNVRPQAADGGAERDLPATPHYNSLVHMDMLPLRHLKLFHHTAAAVKWYLAAVKLCKVWCAQRALDRWGIVFTALLSWLAREGKLGKEWEAEEIWRVAMWTLASHDFTRPLFLTKNSAPLPADEFGMDAFTKHFEVAVVDECGTYNLTWWASKSELSMIQDEARKALTCIQAGSDASFSALFLTPVADLKLRYDHVVRMAMPDKEPAFYNAVVQLDYPNLHSFLLRALPRLLGRALTNRATLIASHAEPNESWRVHDRPASTPHTIFLGINLDSVQAMRLVDPGPPANKQDQVAEFQRLWGKKAELRRFHDGSILEAVVWQASEDPLDRLLIPEQIVRYILERHLSLPASSIMYWAGQGKRFISLGNSSAPVSRFTHVSTVFADLGKILTQFDEIPLAIAQVLPACPELSQCSLAVPQPQLPSQNHYVSPMDVVLEFESSAQWPDDLAAVQQMKTVFYIQFAELLKQHHSIDSQLALGADDADAPYSSLKGSNLHQNPFLAACLDIMYKQYVFRLRIHTTRDAYQLAKMLSSADIEKTQRFQLEHAKALYDKLYIRTPRHTSAMNTLTLRYTALSGTVRLLKRFVSSHLLSSHVDPQVLELLAAHVFTQPAPFAASSSVLTAFVRVLHLIIHYPWKSQQLFVDVQSDVRPEHGVVVKELVDDSVSLAKTLSAGTTNGLASTRINDSATDGVLVTEYARYTISLLVLKRLRLLAKACLDKIDGMIQKSNKPSLAFAFTPPTKDYNLLIHLRAAAITRASQVLRLSSSRQPEQQPVYKNLVIAGTGDAGVQWAGFDPAAMLLRDFERLYGFLAQFHHDEYGGNTVGVVLSPLALVPRLQKASLPSFFKPVKGGSNGATTKAQMVQLDVRAWIREMMRLGDGIVDSIEVVR
ncbi:U3 snoRNP protein [Sorochytrium milnesiophthora]